MIATSANTAGQLSVPAAEDLPHGIDRICLRTRCLRPDDVIPDYFRRDETATG